MAHNCPECRNLCHCQGDIDDVCWDDNSPEAESCVHWKQCQSDEDDDDYFPPDDYDDGLDWDSSPEDFVSDIERANQLIEEAEANKAPSRGAEKG
jgi:hypothetical protein